MTDNATYDEIMMRLERIELDFANLGQSQRNVLYRVQSDHLDDLRRGQAVVSRLEQHIKKLEKSKLGVLAEIVEDQALDVAATDARMDRLSGIIDEYERRLANLEKFPGLATLNEAMVQISDRLDVIDTWRMRHELRVADTADAAMIADGYTKAGYPSDHIRLDSLELSIRAANCLKNAGLVTVGDVRQVTEAYLLHLPNFGKVSLREVKEVIGPFKVWRGEGL